MLIFFVVRYYVIMAVAIKITIFWNVPLRGLVEARFRWAHCSHIV